MDKNTTLKQQQEKTPVKRKANKEITPSFEEALTRLQEIADILENSNPPLDKALTLYEESSRLLKLCSTLLESATQKITVLEKDN